MADEIQIPFAPPFCECSTCECDRQLAMAAPYLAGFEARQAFVDRHGIAAFTLIEGALHRAQLLDSELGRTKLAIPCSTCGAGVGECCTVKRGSGAFHKPRSLAAGDLVTRVSAEVRRRHQEATGCTRPRRPAGGLLATAEPGEACAGCGAMVIQP